METTFTCAVFYLKICLYLHSFLQKEKRQTNTNFSQTTLHPNIFDYI